MNKPVSPIEAEKKTPSEQPFTQEGARVYLISLAEKVNYDSNEVQRRKIVAANELKQLTKEQLESLSGAIRASIDLPETVKKMVETVDLRMLILAETSQKKEVLRQSIVGNQSTSGRRPEDLKKDTAVKTETAEKDTSWLPHSINPLNWNGKQIAVVSTVTVGAIGLYALWNKWRHSKNNTPETETDAAAKTTGFGSMLYWIPGVGLVAAALYAGHQYLLKFNPYAEKIADLEKKYEEAEKKIGAFFQKEKDLLPFVGKSKEEKYGITAEDFGQAEKSYAKTRGADLVEVRRIFNLKEGETNPQYEQFIQDMDEKYKTNEVNGIVYARADVALAHYEASLEVALKQLGQWIGNHEAEIGLIAFALQRTGLLSIRAILSGTLSIGMKSAKVAAELGKMSIRHPLISVFGVGSAFLAMKGSLIASRHLELPENLQELGKAFSNDAQVVLGDAGETISRQVVALKDGAMELSRIGTDFGVWITGAITDFGGKVLNATPDIIGLTQEEVMKIRHQKSLDDLENWIENGSASADNSSKDAKGGKAAKYEIALKQLTAFRNSLIAERLDTVTASDEPQKLLALLQVTLKELDVELETSGGIVRWKTNRKELTDLCVDPSIKDKSTFYARSKEMHEGEESNGSYIFFRAIQHLREKEQAATERGEWLAGENKVVAMAIGNVLYFTDPENRGEFWTAPLSLLPELFGTGINLAGAAFGKDLDWKDVTNTTSDLVIAGTNATLISLSAGTLARAKRLLVGGGSWLNHPFKKHTWRATYGAMNPITSPFKLVRDMARGVIDFETFARLGMYGESGGWYFNSILANAHVRPEWIGIVEDVGSSMEKLRHVATQLDAGKLPKNIDDAREALRKLIEIRLREAHARDLPHLKLKKVQNLNYKDVTEMAKKWYKNRTFVSKAAGQVSGFVEHLGEPVEAAYNKGKAAGKFMAEYASKSGKAVLELLKKYGAAIEADARAGDKAAKMLLAIFRISKASGSTLIRKAPVICAVIDIVMIGKNRWDLSKAKEEGNEGMAQVLESKESALVSNLGMGYIMWELGAVSLPALPVAITTAYLQSEIYDSLITWEKTSKNWMTQSPEELDEELKGIPIGYLNAGHKYGIMTSGLFNYKRLLMSKADREKEFKECERVNEGVRKEILTGILLQKMKPTAVPNETKEQQKHRLSMWALDALQYIGKITDGTYVRTDAPAERYYDAACDYADMCQTRRTLEASGEQPALTYLWDGKEKSIDLRALDFVRKQKNADPAKELKESMDCMKAMSAYHNEVREIQTALQDFQTEFATIETTMPTPELEQPIVKAPSKEMAA